MGCPMAVHAHSGTRELPSGSRLMGLLRLAPEIQQHILSMPNAVHRPVITERALRPIAQIPQTNDQLRAFRQLLMLPDPIRPSVCGITR